MLGTLPPAKTPTAGCRKQARLLSGCLRAFAEQAYDKKEHKAQVSHASQVLHHVPACSGLISNGLLSKRWRSSKQHAAQHCQPAAKLSLPVNFAARLGI